MDEGRKVPTGMQEFDQLVEGGFIRSSTILLCGNPGAGKTIFSARFIYEGVSKYGEPGVYVCFAESKEMFINSMKKFGMDFEALIRRRQAIVLDISVGMEIDVQSALNQILEAITSINARRLVIDSITAMISGMETELKKRHLTRLFYRLVRKAGCTAILVVDMPWGQKKIGSGIEEFIADGIIVMKSLYSNGMLKRQLRIIKMRETNHSLRTHEYTITSNGIGIL